MPLPEPPAAVSSVTCGYLALYPGAQTFHIGYMRELPASAMVAVGGLTTVSFTDFDFLAWALVAAPAAPPAAATVIAAAPMMLGTTMLARIFRVTWFLLWLRFRRVFRAVVRGFSSR